VSSFRVHEYDRQFSSNRCKFKAMRVSCIRDYWFVLLCQKKNFKVGITYLKKVGEESVVFESIGNSIDSKESYAFGWALAKGILKDDDINTHEVYMSIYYNTYDRVTEALNAWFIICKRGIFPGNRDLVKLIAQYVLKFAEDPEIWGI
jgi:hypothetical protein